MKVYQWLVLRSRPGFALEWIGRDRGYTEEDSSI